MHVIQVSETAKQTLQLGRAHHWWWRVARLEPMPDQPVYRDAWWLIPTKTEALPAFARARVEAIRSAGIPIQGIVVAHEAPRLLTAPKEERKAERSKLWVKIAAAATIMLSLVLYATGLALLLGFSLLLDPVVYVVLDDGNGRPTWIEVVRWDEEAPCMAV